MGLPRDEVERIRIAGTLHDIGKIGFSDRVFSDEDPRDSAEMMAEIRMHPEWGRDILKELDFLGPAWSMFTPIMNTWTVPATPRVMRHGYSARRAYHLRG